MIDLSQSHKIVSAEVIFDGKTVSLVERPQGNSGQTRCHFFERKFENFEVILRLDWADLDKNGDPTLDADIYKDGKKYNVGSKQWHHTPKTFENGEYVFSWKPENNELHSLSVQATFKLQTTNIQTISGKARIVPANKTANISKKEMKHQRKLLEAMIGNGK